MSAFSDLMDPTPTPRMERLTYFDSEDVEPQIALELQEYNFPIDFANFGLVMNPTQEKKTLLKESTFPSLASALSHTYMAPQKNMSILSRAQTPLASRSVFDSLTGVMAVLDFDFDMNSTFSPFSLNTASLKSQRSKNSNIFPIVAFALSTPLCK